MLLGPPNVAVQALVRARSEAEREARVACNRVLGGVLITIARLLRPKSQR
jgi:hypothetical protein